MPKVCRIRCRSCRLNARVRVLPSACAFLNALAMASARSSTRCFLCSCRITIRDSSALVRCEAVTAPRAG
ncbi:hypothetical protein PF007_g21839 [Phytophthora fragariae]|uniref:Uncharacterized protein n=1 Tax=Phytophthora fragariae TaxID=53985 RepID=A0A6A3GLR9_9STRA|nr:hypothetical protein PF003_g16193 [Phytophthora fragariae]KAE8940038.1 hypothetical protein PF009_g10153 [Phytophthora fragariae]KAE8958363.1 hypothetical protein PF011_g30797 [Phytophthora fragariae]KAE9083568.1 hypothetical protein PF007_g21839 [Phytophthora fragariae]